MGNWGYFTPISGVITPASWNILGKMGSSSPLFGVNMKSDWNHQRDLISEKMMLGRLFSFPFGHLAYFQGRTVKHQGCIGWRLQRKNQKAKSQGIHANSSYIPNNSVWEWSDQQTYFKIFMVNTGFKIQESMSYALCLVMVLPDLSCNMGVFRLPTSTQLSRFFYQQYLLLVLLIDFSHQNWCLGGLVVHYV